MFLVCSVQDTVTSASLLADSLKGELADGQKKLLSLAENASVSAARAIPVSNQLNGGLPDQVRIHVMTELIK
jgi:enhancer of mRNA-decapping protein 4